MDFVAARDFFGAFAAVFRRGERAQADEDAADVGAGRRFDEIVFRGVQDEFDFLFQRARFVFGVF